MELTAAKFSLFSFCKDPPLPEDPLSLGKRPYHILSEDLSGRNRQQTRHVRLMIDNTTAVSYINHMGGSHSLACNTLSREMWMWAEQHSIWLSAAHIPGVENTAADHYSRKIDDSKEWSLTDNTFNTITHILGLPQVDMFASRTNYKIKPYVSWHPDPDSLAVDAFSTSWRHNYVYCFPPFSQIWTTLTKAMTEQVDALLIAPLWPTQSWYPSALQLMTHNPIVFQASLDHLYLPHKPQVVHPLHPKLHLMALKISGDSSKVTTFQHQLKLSSSLLGETPLGKGMQVSLKNGKHIVLQGTSVPFIQL